MRRQQQQPAPRRPSRRDGTTMVEMGIVLPVFLLMIFAFVEFGHVYMTVHVLNAAAKKASRAGIGDNATTGEVTDRAEEILSSMLPSQHFTVRVKDGSAYDDPNVDPESINFDALPDINLADAQSRQLFIVRVEVPYDEVAILGPNWVQGLQLFGQSVMRKE